MKEVGRFGIVDRSRGNSWDHWSNLNSGVYRFSFSSDDHFKSATVTAKYETGGTAVLATHTPCPDSFDFVLPKDAEDLRRDLLWDGQIGNGHGTLFYLHAANATKICGCLVAVRREGSDTIYSATKHCQVDVITSKNGRVTGIVAVTIGSGNELRLQENQGLRCRT